MLKNNKLPKLILLAISVTLLSVKSASASLRTSIEKTQEASIDCCVDNYHSRILVNTKGIKEEFVRVAVEEGTGIAIKSIKSLFSVHETVHPVENNTAFNVPAGKFGGETRVSLSFYHKSWVPRGSKPIRVRFTVQGVNDDIRRIIRVQMKADKQFLKDGNRSQVLKHGSVFDLKYGTGKDRAYYFAGRNGIRPENLPKGIYFRLERL